MMSSEAYSNHLIREKSPYLLQHAHNPVDWYPWGQEAFDLAKSLDKPIFLSIGYATCHWCHVMEKESFGNPEIARLINEVFVSIKVDREEHPEIDAIYMEFAQALMSTNGGWPLNVILTPDLKPFFAFTYLSPKAKKGSTGLDELIQHMQQLWHSEERDRLVQQADQLVEVFKTSSFSKGEELPDENHLEASIQILFDNADPVYGGIKGSPKFPFSYQSIFLLEFARARDDGRALFFVELTLDKMCQGGIYDHLGGGFSRYSVDEKWHVPHFEKMLCDNAILASVYIDAWRYTKKNLYKAIACEILDYVLRDMTSTDGAFFSAEDADSEGKEGAFYTWSLAEIQQVLSEEEADLVCKYYGLSEEGHFEGRNVLSVSMSEEEFAEEHRLQYESFHSMLQKTKEKLFSVRQARTRPFKDDKILTSWNALMIHALIKAAGAFQEPRYREAALKAAAFIEKNLWKGNQLLRRFRDGEARFNGCLEDYAFLIQALLSIFEQGHGSNFLKWSLEMTKILEQDFKAQDGAFYHTDGSDSSILRRCEFYDGSEPSGNAVHCENLIRLYQMTQDVNFLKHAEDILKAAKKMIEAYPPGASYHLIALQRYLDVKAPTVVVALDENESMQSEISNMINLRFCPHAVFVWKKKNDEQFNAILPFIKDKAPIDGQTAVHICRQDVCLPALINKEEIAKAIHEL